MEKKNINFKGKLIFKKYKIIQNIDKGCFGSIYLGKNILNNKFYAVKFEIGYENELEKEAFIQYNLKGFGIPEVISYGHFGNFNILIETLLGKSIEKIWIEKKRRLDLKDVCMIAIQALDRIEFVHSKNYLHRDIKPSNFLVGNPDSSIIYLIDFGNARKYRSSKTGKHIRSCKINRVFGTSLYLSLNSMKGNEQSRKDDLESLGYMFIVLLKGGLPWSHINNMEMKDIIKKTAQLKAKIPLENLCKNLPHEFYDYMKYVQKLEFEENPDYTYLRGLFIYTLSKLGLKKNNFFSWVDNRKIDKNSNLVNSLTSRRRRISPQMRLLNKIINSNSEKYLGLKSFPNSQITERRNHVNIVNNNNIINNNKDNDFSKPKNSEKNKNTSYFSILKKYEEPKNNLINNIKRENTTNRGLRKILLKNFRINNLNKSTDFRQKNKINKIIINNITNNNILEKKIFYNNSLANKKSCQKPKIKNIYKSALYRYNKEVPMYIYNPIKNKIQNLTRNYKQENINNNNCYSFI